MVARKEPLTHGQRLLEEGDSLWQVSYILVERTQVAQRGGDGGMIACKEPLPHGQRLL